MSSPESGEPGPDEAPATASQDKPKGSTNHRGVAVTLVILATLIGILALVSTWAKRELFNTDQWVKTSSALLANDEIRSQLADKLTAEVFASGAVQEQVAQILPPKAAPLAGPASAGLSQLFNKAVNQILQTSAVQNLWEEANRRASEAFIAIAENKPLATAPLGEAQSKLTEAQAKVGSTTLDLTTIKAAITQKLGITLPDSGFGSGQALGAAVQAGNAQAGLEVIAPDQISALRDGSDLIQKGSVVLLLLAIALYVIAIVVTPATRRRTLTSVGISLVIIGITTLTVRSLLGTAVVDSLAASDSVKPAASAAWTISTELLQTMAVATIFYGVVVLLGAALAGPSRGAVWIRRNVAPALRDPMWASAGTALAIILLIWWSPTPAFHNLLGVILISVLLIAGIFALRRQIVREYPAPEEPTAVGG